MATPLQASPWEAEVLQQASTCLTYGHMTEAFALFTVRLSCSSALAACFTKDVREFPVAKVEMFTIGEFS